MPDPGEVVLADADPTRAARLRGAAQRGEVVHLVTLMPGSQTWSTACPADVTDLPAGADPRGVELVSEMVSCPACIRLEGEAVYLVDARSRNARRRVDRDCAAVVEFFKWVCSAGVDLVPAEFARFLRLRPMPSVAVARLVNGWASSRLRE